MARHWNKTLAEPLVLNDGETLHTLLQAGEFLQANCRGIKSAAVQHTIELLLQAAETGTGGDRRKATDQLQSFLKFNRWV